jgi:hypothetical protein
MSQPPYPYNQPPQYPAPSGGGGGGGPLAWGGMITGIVSACLMLVGLIPCLGWLNWFTLGAGLTANILSWFGLYQEGKWDGAAQGRAITGLVTSFIALGIGSVRLLLGGGIC